MDICKLLNSAHIMISETGEECNEPRTNAVVATTTVFKYIFNI